MITVDAKAAGKGKVTCTVCTPDGTEVDVDVVENEDGTFDIFYTAPQPGKYVICVRFGGEHIPNSPFQVTVSLTVGGKVEGNFLSASKTCSAACDMLGLLGCCLYDNGECDAAMEWGTVALRVVR